MGILFANNVNMQLAADLAADDTSFSVIAGQGSQCPEIAADSTDYMLLKIRNKNGLDEIVKIIEHELNSDTFIIGDSTAVPHTPSTDGRAYEKTLGGYQTALAIKASDAHKITMPVTAATLETALVVAGSGTTTDDFKKLHAITSTHTEINQLNGSGVVKADLEKLHAITSTHTEINQLHGSGVVKADLEKLHAITSTHTEINQLHGSGVVKADLEKLHGITLSYAQINALINNVPPVGSIIAYVPGYFTNGNNAGFTYRMVSANTVAAVNALLNPSGWYVCNGAALNDAGSGIFNGAGRYLPNLTDDRFFMGDTVAGGVGGSSTMAHTHTTGDHTLTIDEIPSHRHSYNAVATNTSNPWTIAQTGNFSIPSSQNTGYTGGGGAHNHGPTGGASNTENRPSYLSCFYIMRVK